ncbi:MAG: 3-phosphoshikimate 1-carboxyvinyltransferase [Hyphomicrobiaceae bacterium]|nr:MAG: 3-phosphoshikimate 1-carboxyvinyltransferase [Hyphomicrobiaceae bacterium]
MTHLSGLLVSDDTYWCSDALRRLGVDIDFDGMNATVTGIGRRRPVAEGVLHVGSAGTVARFLPPFLAAGGKGRWRVTASKQMSRRPVGPLFDTLRAGGAHIQCPESANCFPAVISGDSFRGGKLRMSGNVSSQFISGVLLGAAHSPEGVKLAIKGGIVQSAYVLITLDAMRHFGASVEADEGLSRFNVAPGGYRAHDLEVEADASTATYFAALAAVTGGSVTLSNLAPGTRQPDFGFLEILERLGAKVERKPGGTTITGTGKLKGGFAIDMRPLSDATLTLAALAPFADGPITITGVAHIRHHESDRIAAMCRSLEQLGVPVVEREDGMTISPAAPRFAVLDTHEDHRIAMSLAVLGLAGAGVELREPGCVSKTCPTFFDLIAGLGAKVEEVKG